MDANDDPYKILGLSNDCTESDIKKAYRKLALKHHPDKQTTAEGKEESQTLFAKIANAYEILSDPEEREQYDLRKKYGGAPGTRYTTTKPGGQQTYTSQPTYTSSSMPRTTRRTTTTPTGTGGGPTRTQFSTKDGKFTATVTSEDGTTYTFQGTANGFTDPFEVFRRNFQEKTGEDLPVNFRPKQRTTTTTSTIPMNSPSTTTTNTTTTTTTTSMPKTVRSGTRTSITYEGDMKVITKTETLPNGSTRTSVEKVPAHKTTTTSQPVQTTTSRRVPVTTTTSKPVKITTTRRMVAPTSTASTSNQPVGRSMKTRQQQLPDGRIETITEITETMADGSTRTSSSSKISLGSAQPTRSNTTTTRRVMVSSN